MITAGKEFGKYLRDEGGKKHLIGIAGTKRTKWIEDMNKLYRRACWVIWVHMVSLGVISGGLIQPPIM